MHQGPGGFHQTWTDIQADPPLANPSLFLASLPSPDYIAPCDDPIGCEIQHRWYNWVEPMCMAPLPWTNLVCKGAWIAEPGMQPTSAWTGFCPCPAVPEDYTVGARILGQFQNDLFGTMVESDDKFLYVSAPEHTALALDVPELLDVRIDSGVVYRIRTNLEGASGGLGRLQLWLEPGRNWPNVDSENWNRTDYTMPLPHQYIVENVGSLRGNFGFQTHPAAGAVVPNDCVNPDPVEVSPADEVFGYTPYPASSSGYWVDRTPQIVGPHVDAKIGLIRTVGDVDDDGHAQDFVIGCPSAKEGFTDPQNPTGETVGAIFIVYTYPDPESNYLLDRIASAGAGRLRGVWIKGVSDMGFTMHIGRSFDRAGDFNGDGIPDVIFGNPEAGPGEAIVVLGSRTLQSPPTGWTVAELLETGRAIRFSGAAGGDMAGFNVSGGGDVDGDGIDDILIAAPGADGGAGRIYLIYGSTNFAPVYVEVEPGVWEWQNRDYELAGAGTVEFPSVVFTGRDGSELGGGISPRNVYDTGQIYAYSKAMAALGDIDGDGLADIAMSAIKADPNGLPEAGEAYIFYGRGDLEPIVP